MSTLIQGETLECLLSGLPVDLINVKLFVFLKDSRDILQKFSIVAETGFTQFVPVDANYSFTLSAEATALKKSGRLRGELMLFYTDGRKKNAIHTFTRDELVPSISPDEQALPTT